MMPAVAIRRTVEADMPDPAAGVNAVETVWRVPAGGARLQAVTWMLKTAVAGVDGANPLTLSVRVAGAATDLWALTFGANPPTPLANGLAAVAGADQTLPEGTLVEARITQGVTANIGRNSVQIDYDPLVAEP